MIVSLLKQRAKELKGKITFKLDDMKNYKVSNEECKKNILGLQNQQFKNIDEEFDRIIARVMMKKEALKLNYQDVCQEEVDMLEKEITKVNVTIQDLTKNIAEVDKYIEKIGKFQVNFNDINFFKEKLKLIQGEEYHRELNDLEDKLNKDKILKAPVSTTALLPKIIFDPLLYKEIKHIGITTKGNFVI